MSEVNNEKGEWQWAAAGMMVFVPACEGLVHAKNFRLDLSGPGLVPISLESKFKDKDSTCSPLR